MSLSHPSAWQITEWTGLDHVVDKKSSAQYRNPYAPYAIEIWTHQPSHPRQSSGFSNPATSFPTRPKPQTGDKKYELLDPIPYNLILNVLNYGPSLKFLKYPISS